MQRSGGISVRDAWLLLYRAANRKEESGQGAAPLPVLAASLADSRVVLPRCHVTVHTELSRLESPSAPPRRFLLAAPLGPASSRGRAMGGQGGWGVKGRPAREWAASARVTLSPQPRRGRGRALDPGRTGRPRLQR